MVFASFFRFDNGDSLLHYAINKKVNELCHLLVTIPSLLSVEDAHGRSALLISSENGFFPTFVQILSQTTSPEDIIHLLRRGDTMGRTCLHWLLFHIDELSLSLVESLAPSLLSSLSSPPTSSSGETPLHWLATSPSLPQAPIESVKAILEMVGVGGGGEGSLLLIENHEGEMPFQVLPLSIHPQIKELLTPAPQHQAHSTSSSSTISKSDDDAYISTSSQSKQQFDRKGGGFKKISKKKKAKKKMKISLKK